MAVCATLGAHTYGTVALDQLVSEAVERAIEDSFATPVNQTSSNTSEFPALSLGKRLDPRVPRLGTYVQVGRSAPIPFWGKYFHVSGKRAHHRNRTTTFARFQRMKHGTKKREMEKEGNLGEKERIRKKREEKREKTDGHKGMGKGWQMGLLGTVGREGKRSVRKGLRKIGYNTYHLLSFMSCTVPSICYLL